MKFVVKCLVTSGAANELPEEQATVKEIEVNNPKATLQNLRGAAAVQFRISAHGFRMVPTSTADATVDLSDETKLLSDLGLSDGYGITLIYKNARPREDPPDSGSFAGASAGGDADGHSPAYKTSRIELSGSQSSSAEGNADDEEEDDGSLQNSEADDNDDFVTEFEGPAGELYGRLMEVAPNLVEMRQQFITNPEAVMQRIQREDPTLFQLIAAHQEEFVDFINDEERVRTLQQERDVVNALEAGDLDEEMDEETEEAIGRMIMRYAPMVGGGEEADLAGDEGDMFEAPYEEEENKLILDYAPSEEDETKIQTLVQLGFTYEQCKLAFYKYMRSIDRAASHLFDTQGQL